MPSRPDKKVLSDRGCIGRQPNVLTCGTDGGTKAKPPVSPSLAALLSLKTQTTGLANHMGTAAVALDRLDGAKTRLAGGGRSGLAKMQ
jgi:hypothetical protein